MGKAIKRKLLDLDKTARDLASELNSRYGENLDDSMISKIIGGSYPYRMGTRVMKEIDIILSEWEETE